jgi:hypothetical protein
MELDPTIVKWVEYSFCENALHRYSEIKKSKEAYSTTFRSFCERIRENILRDDLSNRDIRHLNRISYLTNRDYRLNPDELSIIVSNFFVDRKWDKYLKAISLMKSVRWKL